tara:strand:- start:6760 stop:7362 length:603 start_codon:yes stop_codon:yes gene_type:complete
MSEYKIFDDANDNLIVCFGGMRLKFGNFQPFEFLNYLSKTYKNVDLNFFIDQHQCWYHKGLKGITSNIEETAEYLKKIINAKPYKKVIFMGISAGGYASILFGSLCNVNHVLSFIPRTMYEQRMSNENYFDLKNVINKDTKYILYGDLGEKRKKHDHHICQCYNISSFENVDLIKLKTVNMKVLRDNDSIKKQIDKILKS